jgi:hypothetical protein
VKQTGSLAADTGRAPIRPKPRAVYDVTDDFKRPVRISPDVIAVIMTLFGDRLDHILFDEDHD